MQQLCDGLAMYYEIEYWWEMKVMQWLLSCSWLFKVHVFLACQNIVAYSMLESSNFIHVTVKQNMPWVIVISI